MRAPMNQLATGSPPAATPSTVGRRLADTVSRWTWITAALLLLATALSFAGRWFWLFELASHGRMQLLLGAAVVLLVFLLLRRWRGVVVTALLCVANGLPALPLFTARPPANAAAGTGQPLRLLVANVLTRNRQHDRLLQLVREQRPDLVLLQETDSIWLTAMTAGLGADYPHQVVHPRGDNFGIAAFSRLPLARGEVLHLGSAELPTVALRVTHDNAPLDILLTHTLPPVGRNSARLRDEQALAVAAECRRLGERVVMVGDFNVTPWSPMFADVLRDSGLADSCQGFGWQPTWPTRLPAMFRIPIDHCLHGAAVAVVDRRVGPDIGSDHLPLLLELR